MVTTTIRVDADIIKHIDDNYGLSVNEYLRNLFAEDKNKIEIGTKATTLAKELLKDSIEDIKRKVLDELQSVVDTRLEQVEDVLKEKKIEDPFSFIQDMIKKRMVLIKTYENMRYILARYNPPKG